MRYLLILFLSLFCLSLGGLRADLAWFNFFDQGGGGLDIYQNDKTNKWKHYNNHPRQIRAQNPQHGGGAKAEHPNGAGPIKNTGGGGGGGGRR